MRIFERLNNFKGLYKIEKNKKILFFITIIAVVSTIIMAILNTNLTSAMEEDDFLDKTITMLFLGVDSSDDFSKNDGELDSVFLVNYNPKKQNCQIISFSRDTLLPYKESNMKLRYMYKTGGDTLVGDSIENLLKLSLDGVVKVNLNGFRQIIDCIGGIDVYIEKDMNYDDNDKDLHINFKAGETIHLNGEKAEEFFRWRNNNDEDNPYLNDIDRIENQKILINKVIEKVISFNNIANINDMVKVIKNNIETDLSVNEIVSYIKCFTKINKDNIVVTSLQGKTKEVDGISYFIYDKNQINSLEQEYSDLEALNALGYKNTIKIKVINCTKIKGLAGEVKDKLESLGYKNIDISSRNELKKTEIYFKNEKYKNLILEDFGNYKISKNMPSVFDENDEYDVVIALGKDYKKVGETK